MSEPSRRQRNKADKRRRITDAATTLFKEVGFEATTTASIAEAAGIGTGTLYLYVDSKEDLLAEVFRYDARHAWDEAFERIDPDAPLLDQVLSAYLHVTWHHEADPRLARCYFKELLFVSERARSRVDEFIDGFFGRFGQVMEEAKRRHKLADDVAVEPLVRNLFAAWYVLMQGHHTRGTDLETTECRLRQSVATALHGLTPATASTPVGSAST